MKKAGFFLPVTLLMTQLLTAQTNYPATRKTDQQDTYHGTVVADPY